MTRPEPNRTKPQVWPAVSGTLVLTAALAAGQDDYLDGPTRRALLTSLSARDSELDWRYRYASDQQLEGVADWKGRQPATEDEDDFLQMLVVDDQIGPALGREVDAQFARDPEWDATEGDTKLDNTHEVVTQLTAWHREAGLTAAAQDAARTRFWAGRMVGRVYIPDEYRERLLTNPPAELEQALEMIHVQAVDPREGGPIRDRHQRVLGYWYRYTREVEGLEGAQTIVEVHTPTQVLTYREQDGELHLLDDPADNPFYDPQQPQRLRRAEYLMWHADRDGGSAITRSVRAAQDRLNVVSTYKGRNDDQTGYRQFITANAVQPKDSRGNPAPFLMGPGIALNLQGVTYVAAKEGSAAVGEHPQRHTPTWQVVDPLDPERFHHPSMEGWTRSILGKLDQAWILDAALNTSAVSKRESRKPFERRVAFAAQDAGMFIAWALRAALLLAGQILGRDEYREVTFQPKMYLDVDAVNLEEVRLKLQMWQAGALTLSTLLEATPGVSDAVKEAEALDAGEGTSEQAEAKRRELEALVGGGEGA